MPTKYDGLINPVKCLRDKNYARDRVKLIKFTNFYLSAVYCFKIKDTHEAYALNI